MTEDIDALRLRMWKARSSLSRTTGLSLLGVGAVLFTIAYFTGDFAAEVASVVSFTIGIILLASEVEPRVKLQPSTMSVLGAMKAIVNMLQAKGWNGKSRFVRDKDKREVEMEFPTSAEGKVKVSPVGHGLFESYAQELGDLEAKDLDIVMVWLPRVIVDGLGLAEQMKMDRKGDFIISKMKKPFVRPLCVNEFMTQNVCNSMGCPLVASIGETLVKATGDSFRHESCTYDPLSQTATAIHLRVREVPTD